ncbi:MAG TPA: hypothetical protein VKY89_13985 [Thermoanaerobaculia bacterium]|nr:hypothetical protein [Thermoanaerobaculia bacterium]
MIWPLRPGWPWYQWLFLALALAYVTPFWVVRFVPTVDGPCHLYNAWMLLHLHDAARYPWIGRYFEVVARPVPNWLTHLLLAGLMGLVPPLVSEKLLLSGYVLLLLGGLWYLAGAVDAERRWLAFLGFLFVFSLPLQFGFYNFCFSLALFAIAVGYAWRRRDDLDLGAAVKLNLLLWLCYFAHVVSTVMALCAITVLWLATTQRAKLRRRLLSLAALAPQAVLPVWFVAAQGGSPSMASSAPASLLADFVRLAVFVGLEAQARLGALLALAFALLLALSIAYRLRRRQRSAAADLGFLALAAGFAALYFLAPEGMAGGTLIKLRLAAYPWLILIPWLAPGLPGGARAAGVGVLAALAVLNLTCVIRCYREVDRLQRPFVGGLEAAAGGSVIVPLLFDRYGGCSRGGYLGHTLDYVAIDKGLVDWGDYEAMTNYFPLRFKAFAGHDTYQIEAAPGDVEPRELKRQVDYVYCWKMPRGSPIERRLRRNFILVADTGDARLYRRPRRPAPPPPPPAVFR